MAPEGAILLAIAFLVPLHRAQSRKTAASKIAAQTKNEGNGVNGYVRLLINVFSIGFGVVVSLLTAELVLYISGYPNNYVQPEYLPGATEPDPVLGWKHRPGSYVFQDPQNSSRIFHVTYLQDGSRVTSNFPRGSMPKILLLGCSFVEGFGLDDKETFAWKLQEMLPDKQIRNFGAGGYGTSQSLLLEKEYLTRNPEISPELIVYGFADFHLARNVRNPAFQRYWNSPGVFPYCDMNSCATWSGKQEQGFLHLSRLFSFIENRIDLMGLPSKKEMEGIALRLMQEMSDIAAKRNVRFLVAPVFLEDIRWIDRLQSANLQTVLCDSQELHKREYQLRDGHPNEKWSEVFAGCLVKNIQFAVSSKTG